MESKKKDNRSKLAKDRRIKKRLKKMRTLTAILGSTEGLRQAIPDHPFHLIYPSQIISPTKDILIKFWPQVVSQTMLATLETSLMKFISISPPRPKKNTNRGEKQVYHLGCWRKQMKKPQISSDTRLPGAEEFLEANAALFNFVSDYLSYYFPELYKLYAEVKMPKRYVGVFAMVSINVNFRTTKHRDKDDYRNGYCWVLPFGDYKNGELIFYDTNFIAPLKPGDLICFQSHRLEHGNAEYEGKRYSLVFFTNNDMFFDCLEDEKPVEPKFMRKKKIKTLKKPEETTWNPEPDSSEDENNDDDSDYKPSSTSEEEALSSGSDMSLEQVGDSDALYNVPTDTE